MSCPECGDPKGGHFVPPSLGEKGFYICDAVKAHEKKQLEVRMCGPSTQKCVCKCPNGPCEHQWDGEPVREYHDNSNLASESSTCSRCGMDSMAHDMWVSP